jgi:hypothetical protein
MSQITMPENLPDTALVSDPACGSGRFLIAGIKRNRFATFIGTDTDLTCVHMTTLNCLVRNANTYIIHGNSLSLASYGGYHVRRTAFGGELYRLTQQQTDALLRAPFSKTKEADTALTPTTLPPAQPLPTVQEPQSDQRQALDAVAATFTTNKKGQRDFGF